MRAGKRQGIYFITRVALALGLFLSLPSDQRAERLPLKSYTTADGLARDQVNRIVRDSRGFLWLCTPEGLSRFDGYRFTNYTIADGLPHRSVRDLLETRGGAYWVATGDGLCRFNLNPQTDSRQLFTVYRLVEPKATHAVRRLYEDRAGTVWVGTADGLYRLGQTGGQVKLDFVEMGMPTATGDDRLIEAILEDRRGSLWVGTRGSGLYRRWPDGRVERYTTKHGLAWDHVRALWEDRAGQMWVGTYAGLCRLVAEPKPNQPVVARTYTTRDGMPGNWVTALFQSSDGRLWIGTDRQGLAEFLPAANNGQQFRGYAKAQGLPDLAISALGEDRDGNLWIGTESSGALKLHANGFITYTEADGLPPLSTASIFENQMGELCLAGRQFILRFDGHKFVATRPNFPSRISYFGWGWSQITLQDHLGEWWAPTGQGLVRFPKVSRVEDLARTRPKAVYTTKDGLIADDVFRLFEDSRGDLWISAWSLTEFGLTRWERATGVFHRYGHRYGEADQLPSSWIAGAFGEDAAGNVWIGFENGLARYRAGRFTVFRAADGLQAGTVRGLYRDSQRRLWVATDVGGVSRIDDPAAERPRFATYTMAEGLSSNETQCITEDLSGRIYIGTGRGVNRLDPATGQIRHYTTVDGLAASGVSIAYRDRSGALWFGTGHGISRLIPENAAPRSPPPILIDGLRIAGHQHPVSELGEVEMRLPELGPRENQLQLDFVGLSFSAGETLRYQYKLEGADRDWSAPSDQRTVNYANLSPGRYRFLARALSAEGVLSKQTASVSFTILPPVWRRWWFLTLAVLLVGLSGYGLHRYRVARLLALERMRMRIATDLHDDIGSNLSQIAVWSEVAKRQSTHGDLSMNGEAFDPLEHIATTARETGSAMSDIVWAINPRRDHLSDLVLRMRYFAGESFGVRDIAWRFSAPETDFNLNADTRRELFLIFKESVNNILRHSRCANVEIALSVNESRLRLTIADDGCGFDLPSREGTNGGAGLDSLRLRAKNLGGLLTINSAPGSGTTVKLEIPLSRSRWRQRLWR